MTKTYSIDEIKPRLAKHLRNMISRAADTIQDLAKREQFLENMKKHSLMDAGHMEPGQHEPAQVGVPEHMEPGQHEQVALDPAQGPDMNQPVQGGLGVPAGQQETPIGDGPCPLCGQPENGCQCLDNLILGKSELVKMSPVSSGALGGAPGAPGAGPGMMAGAPGGAAAAPVAPAGANAIGGGAGISTPLSLSEPMCKGCGKMHKAGPCMGKAEAAAGLPPDKGGKKVKSAGDVKIKANPLGKAAVPEAKPPSGKVPGQAAPPIASTTSKPGVTKAGLEKAVMPAAAKQAQQHGLIAGSKAAQGAPAAAAPAPTLTHPGDPTRANMNTAALGGAFQPKGPIHSGLELDTKPKPLGLKPPPVGVKQTQPAPVAPKPGIFGKSEICPFCRKSEHPGDCTAK